MLIRTPIAGSVPVSPAHTTAPQASNPRPVTGGPRPTEWPSTPTDALMALATSADTCGAVDPAETVRTAVFRLDPVPESAGRARRAARTMLTDWRLERLVEDVDLVVSELVTNALLHSGEDDAGAVAPIRFELDLRDARLTCRVVDSSPLPPCPEEAAETAESGRGLILVEALATDWDWEDLPDGKAVWAAFDL